MIKIDYKLLKNFCKEKGLNVLEATYLGDDGILGRFFPPNIILINPKLCDNDNCIKQRRVLVLLHEVCHWLKWQEHKNNSEITDEEACFEFEYVVCECVLNGDIPINENFEAINRLGLQKPISFLKEVIQKCSILDT